MKLTHNVQKKQHRERAQPVGRKKHGLLEKKKDYKLRAADYHRKEAALKTLRQRAAERNPDEYYHAMHSRATDERGILISERDAEVLTPAQVQLLKTQDVNYINTLRSEELKQVKRWESETGFSAKGHHTVFVDSVEQKATFDAVKHFKTDKSMIGSRENRLRTAQLQNRDALVKELDESSMPKESLDRKRLKKYARLQRHMKRVEELKEVQERMDAQREGMKSGDKKKVLDAKGRKTYVFKKERKR